MSDDRTILGIRVSPRFSRYTVIYKQIGKDVVHVLRVVHSARNIQAILDRLS